MNLRQLEAIIERIEDVNPDDPRLIELNAQANELADKEVRAEDAFKAQMAQREIEQRELALKERITSKTGNYLSWMEWAESLYPITEEDKVFTVTSNAQKWKEPMVWRYGTKIECLEQIERLIGYKINDRNRGFGDMSNDLKGTI